MVSDSKLCEKIGALDPRIFFVGVFKGERLLAGGPVRERTGLIREERRRLMLRMQLHLVKVMVRDWMNSFGACQEIALRFDRAILCALPWGEKWVHVVAKPTLAASAIRKKVQPLLGRKVKTVT